MAADPSKHRLLVVVDDQDAAKVLAPSEDLAKVEQERHRLVVANELLAAEAVKLPSGLDLPWTARTLLAGLGGWVGSPAFWNQEKDAMRMWASKRPTDGVQLFKSHCDEPVVSAKGLTGWSLDYSYFNLQGGVEAWAVEGNAHQLTRASARMALPNGTFFVPYA